MQRDGSRGVAKAGVSGWGLLEGEGGGVVVDDGFLGSAAVVAVLEHATNHVVHLRQ